ncbi:unnamed protein product [Chrysoparadoxa australica]
MKTILLIIVLLSSLVGSLCFVSPPLPVLTRALRCRDISVRAAAGEPMILTEENVEVALDECRQQLGAVFGYTSENRAVGITGEVDFVGLDGPGVVIRLTGRFWHERSVVLDRVASFVQQRIPECIEVMIEDPSQLIGNITSSHLAEWKVCLMLHVCFTCICSLPFQMLTRPRRSPLHFHEEAPNYFKKN